MENVILHRCMAETNNHRCNKEVSGDTKILQGLIIYCEDVLENSFGDRYIFLITFHLFLLPLIENRVASTDVVTRTEYKNMFATCENLLINFREFLHVIDCGNVVSVVIRIILSMRVLSRAILQKSERIDQISKIKLILLSFSFHKWWNVYGT